MPTKDSGWATTINGKRACKTCGLSRSSNPINCSSIKHKEYYNEHLKSMIRFNEDNPLKWKEYDLVYKENHPKEAAARHKRHRDKIKLKVFIHYCKGTLHCMCPKCPYPNVGLDFLTIDHASGNGNKHQSPSGRRYTSYYLLLWLIKNNFPEGFQILCFNCNCAKTNRPSCPHVTDEKPTNDVNSKKKSQEHRRWRQKLKLRVFTYYSNGAPKCSCTKCPNPSVGIEFLTLDHIDSTLEDEADKNPRGRHLTGTYLYRWIVKNGFPKGFRVLCYNCNCAKGNKQECPHVNPPQ